MSSQRFSPTQLRLADIIVSTTGAAVSKTIQKGIGASVSHSMLYVGGGEVIEAIGTGVVRRPLQLALAEATLAMGLRRRNLTDEKKAEVIGYAEGFQSQSLPYDKVGAIGSGMNGKRGGLASGVACSLIGVVGCSYSSYKVWRNSHSDQRDTAFFCSELVARCFELADMPIVSGSASFANPRHLRVSDKLYYMGKIIDK